MRLHDVQITGLTPGYGGTKITIDGTQMPTHRLTGLSLQADVDDIPRLTLDIVALKTTEISGQMQIVIPDETRELLTTLGWTPPTDG